MLVVHVKIISEWRINNEAYDTLLIHKPTNLLVNVTFTAYHKKDKQFKNDFDRKQN